MRDKIEGKRNRVVYEALAEENFRGVRRINFPVAHGAALQFETVETRALLHQHPAFLRIPKRLAVRHPHDVRPQIERPERIKARTRASEEPRGFHDLGGNNPARGLRRRAFFRVAWGRVGGRFSFRFLAARQHRARKQRHAPVVRRFVAAVLFVEVRDVAEQTGENTAVDRAIGGRAKNQVL